MSDAPKARRGRPTKIEQELKKLDAQARAERLRRGKVTMLIWPANPEKGEQRVFCSRRCILQENDWDWQTPITLAEARRAAEEEPDWITEYDPPEAELPRLIKKGHWPLTRYEVSYPYATDVDHVKCVACDHAMRPRLTPWQWKQKEKERQAKEAIRREQWKAQKAAEQAEQADKEAKADAKRTPEQRAAAARRAAEEARRVAENLEDRRARNRERMAERRKQGKLTITERAAAAEAKKWNEFYRQRNVRLAAEDALLAEAGLLAEEAKARGADVPLDDLRVFFINKLRSGR